MFKLSPPGRGETACTETILHGFTGDSDRYERLSELIADSQGALFETNAGGYAYRASEGTVELESTGVVEVTLCGLAARPAIGACPCPAFPDD